MSFLLCLVFIYMDCESAINIYILHCVYTGIIDLFIHLEIERRLWYLSDEYKLSSYTRSKYALKLTKLRHFSKFSHGNMPSNGP